MRKHVLAISQPPKETPAAILPDGAITGNGDVTVTLGGTADRVRLHIGKADFWKADGRVYTEHRGGISPLGLVDILLPHLAYADYQVEQNLDEAYIKLTLTEKKCSATVKATVCAVENIILIELDRTYPSVSSSISLLPLEGGEAVACTAEEKDVRYSIRGFDTPTCRFPSFGICALRQISRTIANGREHIIWAITVRTNHDTAAYKHQAIERVRDLDETTCQKLLTEHRAWWQSFWAKSSVELPDEIDTDLTDLTVTAEMIADGDTLKEMNLPQGALVMIVKRGTEFLVPNGSLHLQVGDKLLLISEGEKGN